MSKFIKISVDKDMTSTIVNQDNDFTEIMVKSLDSIEIPNLAYEYFYDSCSSEILKALLSESKTFTGEFEVVDFEPKEESISSLKKQIKNCKNPMQLKELNQKLNAAYKKRKRKK